VPEGDDDGSSNSKGVDNKFGTSLFPTRAQVEKDHANFNHAFFGNDPENDELDNVRTYTPFEIKL
jgi:hypothetical protein